MNTKMDTKIHSTHAYRLMLMSRPSSLAHKLLVLMFVLMLASLVRTRLYRPEARGYVIYSPRALPSGGQRTRAINHITTS